MSQKNQELIPARKLESRSNAWINSLPELQKRFVEDCVESVVQFSQGTYKDFFDYCALYACGSSLTKSNPNDIDLVLVGLDFRSVVNYDKVFLQDPETLITKGIIEEPRVFQVEQEENGEPTILKPVDINTLEGMSRFGMEYNGKRYDYNVEGYCVEGLDLESYCANSAGYSDLVKKLFSHLIKFTGHPNQKDYWSFTHDPFEQYFHDEEYFLTTPLTLYSPQIKFEGGQPVPDEIKIPVLPIDFRIHTENLLNENWKQHQKNLGFPFELLHFWTKSECTDVFQRPYLTQEKQPNFIDENGKDRVSWHPYFSYLREPPIEIKSSK